MYYTGNTMNQRVVTFKLSEELLQKIDEAAKTNGFDSRSELIRKALEEYLKGLKNKQNGGYLDENNTNRLENRQTDKQQPPLGLSVNDEEDRYEECLQLQRKFGKKVYPMTVDPTPPYLKNKPDPPPCIPPVLMQTITNDIKE